MSRSTELILAAFFLLSLNAIVSSELQSEIDNSHSNKHNINNVINRDNVIVIVGKENDVDSEINNESGNDDVNFSDQELDVSRDRIDQLNRLISFYNSSDTQLRRAARMAIYEHEKREHIRKVGVVVSFMNLNWSTADYLYAEVVRIKKTNEVLDELRKMVRYVEQPGMEKLMNKLLSCFQVLMNEKKKRVDMWAPKTNNLVINHLKDAYNENA